MDIYQLRSFVVLAEFLHFGRAAQVLHLSQPALSKQMQKLEQEVGAPLFERDSVGTRLSALGKQWLPQAKTALAGFDEALFSLKNRSSGVVGELRLGFGNHSLDLVPKLVAKLRVKNPRIQINLRDMSTAEQIKALNANEIDLGFLRMPFEGVSDCEILPVIEDRLALVIPNHLDFGPKPTLSDCKDQPFVSISRSRSPGFFDHFLNLCAANAFFPRVTQEVYEFPTAIALARAGMGVTVIPQSFATQRFQGVKIHRLPKAQATWQVAAVWKKRHPNPTLAPFVELVKKATNK